MAQLIARSVWDREAEGLSPFTPTKINNRPSGWLFILVRLRTQPSPRSKAKTASGSLRETFRWQLVANREVSGSPKVTESLHFAFFYNTLI